MQHSGTAAAVQHKVSPPPQHSNELRLGFRTAPYTLLGSVRTQTRQLFHFHAVQTRPHYDSATLVLCHAGLDITTLPPWCRHCRTATLPHWY